MANQEPSTNREGNKCQRKNFKFWARKRMKKFVEESDQEPVDNSDWRTKSDRTLWYIWNVNIEDENSRIETKDIDEAKNDDGNIKAGESGELIRVINVPTRLYEKKNKLNGVVKWDPPIDALLFTRK